MLVCVCVCVCAFIFVSFLSSLAPPPPPDCVFNGVFANLTAVMWLLQWFYNIKVILERKDPANPLHTSLATSILVFWQEVY